MRKIWGISEEEYSSLWNKCIRLKSLSIYQRDMNGKFEELKKMFALYSLHLEMRSPWVIQKPQKRVKIEKVFGLNQPGHTMQMTSVVQGSVYSFIQDVYEKRVPKLQEIEHSELIFPDQPPMEMNQCEINPAVFAATFVVPPLFGHFLGKTNIEAFIGAVGLCFDAYADNSQSFLLDFDNSFLCHVLRQFFFSPVMRKVIGEEFTVFFDFFSCMKKNDTAHYARLQRFFALFLSELTGTIAGCATIRALMTRITRKYEDKASVIMTVITYCIVSQMVRYPCEYAVIPLTSNYNPESDEAVRLLTYYCASVSQLPIPEHLKGYSPPKEIEVVDPSLIQKLVDEIMKPGEVCQEAEVECMAMPFAAICFLAKMDNYQLDTADVTKFTRPEVLIRCPLARRTLSTTYKSFIEDKEITMVIDYLRARHTDSSAPLQPAMLALEKYLETHPPDYNTVLTAVDNELNELSSCIMNGQIRVNDIEKMLESAKTAIASVESVFANRIAESMYKKGNIGHEVERKKSTMLKNNQVFATYVCNAIDTYTAKNTWIKPYLPMIARRFLVLVMNHFKLSDFSEKQKPMVLIDQKFLTHKMHVLDELEKNSQDPCVKKLLASPTVFQQAQMGVMRACLFENPIESAKQLVMSLYVVEELFVFEFGVPPEANQLMPLLAHLFILSPVPAPLSFGRWLNHFLQPLMKIRPTWFLDEELRPLEHYFQFNSWMEDMLQSYGG